MTEEVKKTYIVVDTVSEMHDVSTLKLMLVGDIDKIATADKNKKIIPTFVAGQFITIYFPEMGTPEGKAYSISSAPHEPTLNITVKAMGEFSRRLVALRSGDKITASLPYGFFYSESDKSDLLMLAGGIGVAPFRSMIVDSLKRNPQRKLRLFYSIQKRSEIIFEKELSALQLVHHNFNVTYFVTRETAGDNTRREIFFRRMSADDVLETTNETIRKTAHDTDREFLLCGSIAFVRDMWRGLRAHNVSEISIYTEAFFSH